jgi:hypothetical protein
MHRRSPGHVVSLLTAASASCSPDRILDTVPLAHPVAARAPGLEAAGIHTCAPTCSEWWSEARHLVCDHLQLPRVRALPAERAAFTKFRVQNRSAAPHCITYAFDAGADTCTCTCQGVPQRVRCAYPGDTKFNLVSPGVSRPTAATGGRSPAAARALPLAPLRRAACQLPCPAADAPADLPAGCCSVTLQGPLETRPPHFLYWRRGHPHAGVR